MKSASVDDWKKVGPTTLNNIATQRKKIIGEIEELMNVCFAAGYNHAKKEIKKGA